MNLNSGRDYSVHSLAIHEPKCMEKWEKEQSLLPASKRRPRPVKPTEIQIGADTKKEDLLNYNEQVREAYLENRVPCERCGRKFASQDRVDVHLRSCKGAKEKPEPKTEKPKEPKKEKPEPKKVTELGLFCTNCGGKHDKDAKFCASCGTKR